MKADGDRQESGPPPHADLLSAIVDGQPLDWPGAEESTGSVRDRRRQAALQGIARIAEFNREQQRTADAEIADSDAALPPDAERWGDLVLLEKLGMGASGEVWHAWDTRLQREVALKFLKRQEAAVAFDPESARAALLAEARGLARIRHPGVVTVLGVSEHEGRVGMWMELLRGETLAAAIEGGPLRQAEVARVGRELASALDAVHAAGLVHCDVKPANVVLQADGRVVLTDFGLRQSSAAGSGRLSLSGTPIFMAPELLSGSPATKRSDLYALGVTLRWALTGKCPFAAVTIDELRAEAARGPATPLLVERPHTSPALVIAIERAMAVSAEKRFASAAELARALAGDDPASVGPHTLPAETDTFVGRDADLEELEGRLEIGSRLVTLIGAGGMGKTRLAVRYSWQRLTQWPGGVWFCDLTEVRGLDGIVAAVGSSLGVPLGKGDPVVQIGYAIRGRGRCLVVLDNFEQVSRHAAETVGRWLERTTDARFLVTSRERLNLPNEDVQPVEPLSLQHGAALFRARARRHLAGFAPAGAAAEAVQQLVRLVDGMPLAIELAAARVRIMAVDEIVSRMRDRFLVLAGPGSGRHASLRAVIDGSWELLNAREKSAWAQCAVFEGGFTPAAAEAVVDLAACPEAPWIVDVLQSLVGKSLLQISTPKPELGTAASGAETLGTRLRMVGSLQEYARAKLEGPDAIPGGASGAEAQRSTEERHGRWYARVGTEALAALDGPNGVRQWRRLAAEIDNLVTACRRAITRGDVATSVACHSAIWAVLELRGPLGTAVELGREILRDLRLGRGDEAKVLMTLGMALWRSAMIDEARSHFESALGIADELGDRLMRGRLLGHLSGTLSDQGRYRESPSYLEEAIALARITADRPSEAINLGRLGVALKELGRMEEARDLYEKALALHRELGNRRFEGITLTYLASLETDRGNAEAARPLQEAALAIHREVGNRFFEGVVLGNLGALNTQEGRMEEARAKLEAALAIARELGNRSGEGAILHNLGSLHLEQGRFGDAQASLASALIIHDELGNRRKQGNTLYELGRLNHKQGELDEARSHYDAALAIHREVGNRHYEGAALVDLGNLLRQQGLVEAARDTLAAAEPILRALGGRADLGRLLCTRAELEHAAGRIELARAALREAEALTRGAGSGPESELGRMLAEARSRLG